MKASLLQKSLLDDHLRCTHNLTANDEYDT